MNRLANMSLEIVKNSQNFISLPIKYLPIELIRGSSAPI
jgi:hypothetical protein